MSMINDLASFGPAQWSASIKIEADGQVTFLLILQSGNVHLPHKIPGMRFCGTAMEIEQELKDALQNVTIQTKSFFQNEKEYQEALEEAKKKTAEARKKTLEENSKKTVTASSNQQQNGAKTKQFEAAMKKVLELESAGKIGQAIAQLPNTKDFPSFEPQITARLMELKRKHQGFSLFADNDTMSGSCPPTTGPEEEPQKDTDAEDDDQEEEDETEEAA